MSYGTPDAATQMFRRLLRRWGVLWMSTKLLPTLARGRASRPSGSRLLRKGLPASWFFNFC